MKWTKEPNGKEYTVEGITAVNPAQVPVMENLLSQIKNMLRPRMNWRPMSELPYNEGHLLFKVNTGQGFVYYIGGTVEGQPSGPPECLIGGIEGFIRIRP